MSVAPFADQTPSIRPSAATLPPLPQKSLIARRRALILGSTAILSTCLFLATAPMADAACVVSGTGSVTAPQSGDSVTCTGAGLVNPIVAAPGSTDVTITIGDATTPTDLTVADANAVEIDSESTVIVKGNTTVATAGNDDHGILGMGNNNRVIIDGGSISTSGQTASGVVLFGNNNSITINSGSVITTGRGSIAVGAASGSVNGTANVQINGGVIRTEGDDSFGLAAQGTIATVNVTSGYIRTDGDDAQAITAFGGVSSSQASVTVSGGTIETSGENSNAITARTQVHDGARATVSIDGGTITTTGIESHGAIALADSGLRQTATVNVRGGTISTAGDDSVGAFADLTNVTDSSATVNITGGTITTTGDDAAGAKVSAVGVNSDATVNVGGTASISTAGESSHGAIAYASLGNATVNVSGGASISTDDFSAHGAYALADQGTATVNVSGGAITVDRSSSYGVRALSEGAGESATVTISGGTIEASGLETIAVGAMSTGDDGTATVTISGGSILNTYESSTGAFALAGSDNGKAIINVTAGEVRSTGDSANAVFINAEGLNATATVNLRGGTISAIGDFANAIDVSLGQDGQSSAINISGGTVTASGDNARAIVAYQGTGSGGAHVVTISGGTVAATGSDSEAVHLINRDGAASSLIIGTEASVTGNLAAANTGSATADLIFNDVGTGRFDDDIDGFTTISKVDSGTWTMSGAITNSGDISVGAGTLVFDGSTDSAVSVLSGGTLSGSGSFAGTDFQSGSTYRVDLSSSGFLTSTEDVTIDSGASLDLVSSGSIDSILGTPITILTATVINGDFGTVNDGLLFYDATLANLGTTLEVTIDRNDASFSDFTATANQAATASAVESLGIGNAIFDTVLTSRNAEEAQDAFDQLSGEAHASLQGGLMAGASLVRDVVGNRLGSSFGGIMARTLDQRPTASIGRFVPQATAGPSYDVWRQVYGVFGRTDSDGNAAEMTRATGGTLFGVETGEGSDWRGGAFAGYGRTGTDVEDRASSADADSYTFGAYAGRSTGPLRMQFGTSFSWHEVGSNRTVDFGGFTDELEADYSAATAQVFGEVGYAVAVDGLAFEPFAGAALVYQRTGDFTETGGGAALSVASSSDTLAVTTIGLRTAHDYGRLANGTRITLDGSLGWNHVFGNVSPSTTMAFASGSDVFTVSGTPLDRDMARIETGLTFGFENGMDLSIRYIGTLGSNATDHGINAALKAKF